MILLPAVDIRDGRAVRLRQGDFADETVYADDPFEAARSFVEAGARFLHVVDLDGARQGEPVNLHHVERIAGELGVPVIGLCMGMQLLFESTEELGGAEGIGLLKGTVVRLNAPRVPQIGWNPVSWRRRSTLNDGLPDPCAFYHANSYVVRAGEEADVLGTADYGGEFVSVVERPPVYGLQSHPEKSGPDGLRLLRNFVSRS